MRGDEGDHEHVLAVNGSASWRDGAKATTGIDSLLGPCALGSTGLETAAWLRIERSSSRRGSLRSLRSPEARSASCHQDALWLWGGIIVVGLVYWPLSRPYR
jgi:hypothetical protein